MILRGVLMMMMMGMIAMRIKFSIFFLLNLHCQVFHLKCFTCFVCRKQLLTGEELYVVDDTKFVCKEDYTSGGRGLNDSLYDDEDELEDEESRLDDDHLHFNPLEGKHGNANE